MSDIEEVPEPQISEDGSGSDHEDEEMPEVPAPPPPEEEPPKEEETSSNIHRSSDYMELDEPHVADDKKALLEEFERKKRARMMTVPTDDIEVK